MSITFEVPNLDDASVDPLDYAEAARVFDLLRQYANAKGMAIRYRLAGNVDRATRVERYLNLLHADLPDWARW